MSSPSSTYSYSTFNKRGQEELDPSTMEESISKKFKFSDGSGSSGGTEVSPSKVLHVRSLPLDTTEQDLLSLASPFGHVENVLLLRGKNQAFIQLHDVSAASTLVHYYSSVQASIRGRPIHFQFSPRSEITPPTSTTASSSSSGSSSSSAASSTPNNILLVTILNVLYPVTVDTLYQVFSLYGTIFKIVLFTSKKKGDLQSLIQFKDVSSAVAAKEALEGRNIYTGACTLHIQFSSLADLTVKFNDEKSRDYTNPSLPRRAVSAFPAFPGGASMGGGGWAGGMSGMGLGVGAPGGGGAGGAGGTAWGGGPVLLVSNLDPERVNPDILFTLFGVFGDVLRVKILFSKRDTALIQFPTPHQAETALKHLNGCPLKGKPLHLSLSKHSSISLPLPGTPQEGLTKDFSHSPLHRFKVAGSKNYQHIFPPSPLLHVSNLPPTITEDEVRVLFSQFGSVVSVKFLPAKKDKKMALVELSSVDEAVEALTNLHNYRVADTNIRISFSKIK